MSDEEKAAELVRASTKGLRATIKGGMGIVRCPGYRCLGVKGKDGVWRDARERVLNVIEVITEF